MSNYTTWQYGMLKADAGPYKAGEFVYARRRLGTEPGSDTYPWRIGHTLLRNLKCLRKNVTCAELPRPHSDILPETDELPTNALVLLVTVDSFLYEWLLDGQRVKLPPSGKLELEVAEKAGHKAHVRSYSYTGDLNHASAHHMLLSADIYVVLAHMYIPASWEVSFLTIDLSGCTPPTWTTKP
mgnify:CR=1 FL=1